jgi:hypothetical protein
MGHSNLDSAQAPWLESYLSNWSRTSLIEISQGFGGLAGFLRERAEVEEDVDTVRNLNAIAKRLEG